MLKHHQSRTGWQPSAQGWLGTLSTASSLGNRRRPFAKLSPQVAHMWLLPLYNPVLEVNFCQHHAHLYCNTGGRSDTFRHCRLWDEAAAFSSWTPKASAGPYRHLTQQVWPWHHIWWWQGHSTFFPRPSGYSHTERCIWLGLAIGFWPIQFLDQAADHLPCSHLHVNLSHLWWPQLGLLQQPLP